MKIKSAAHVGAIAVLYLEAGFGCRGRAVTGVCDRWIARRVVARVSVG